MGLQYNKYRLSMGVRIIKPFLYASLLQLLKFPGDGTRFIGLFPYRGVIVDILPFRFIALTDLFVRSLVLDATMTVQTDSHSSLRHIFDCHCLPRPLYIRALASPSTSELSIHSEV